MFYLLLPLLILSADNVFPKISYFLVNSGFSRRDIERIDNWGKYKDDILSKCDLRYRKDKVKQCKAFINSIASIVCSNGKDVNDKLSKVSKKTEFLFYLMQTKHSNVDFNSLKSKMSVFMLSHHFTSHRSAEDSFNFIKQSLFDINMQILNSSYNGEFENNLQLMELVTNYNNGNSNNNNGYSNNNNGNNNNNNGNNFIEVEINGNIENKVSFLTISNLKVIYYNDFRCENLYITNTIITPLKNSFVRVNTFIVDVNSYTNYSISKIDVDKFSILDFNSKTSYLPHYKIVYLNKSYGVQYRYDDKFNKSNNYNWLVNYSITKKFSLMCHSFHIVIEAGPFVLNKYSDINITIIDKKLPDSLSFLDPSTLSSNEILIESKGFDLINPSKWPSIDVTYNKSKYSLDTTNLDLDIKEYSLFSYKPHNSSVNVGLIIAIVGVVVIVIIVVIIVVVARRRKNKNNQIYDNSISEKTLLNNNDQYNNNNNNNSNGQGNLQSYHAPTNQVPQFNETYYPTPPYAPPPSEIVYPSNNSKVSVW